MSPYNVRAEWDEEAQVWVASSDDVPGLATGGDTFEQLVDKLKVVIPDLLEANGILAGDASDDVPFAITAERLKQTGLPKAS